MVLLEDDLSELTWSTNEAAEAAHVEPRRIRVWAHRKHLVPINPGSPHPRYRALDVLRVEARMAGRIPAAA